MIRYDEIGTRKIYGGWEAFFFQDSLIETIGWPEALGATEEEAIENLKKKYQDKL